MGWRQRFMIKKSTKHSAPKYDRIYLLYMMTVPLSAIQMTAQKEQDVKSQLEALG